MIRIIIESPFSGDTERNLAYAREALLHSLSRGEAPFASHLLYPQVLNDLDPDQRGRGIEAGFAWWPSVAYVAFYVDLGWSLGMRQALERAAQLHTPVVIRRIRK